MDDFFGDGKAGRFSISAFQHQQEIFFLAQFYELAYAGGISVLVKFYLEVARINHVSLRGFKYRAYGIRYRMSYVKETDFHLSEDKTFGRVYFFYFKFWRMGKFFLPF